MKKLAISLFVIIALFLGTTQITYAQKEDPIKPIEKYKTGTIFKFNENAAVILIREIKTGQMYVLHKNSLDPITVKKLYKLYHMYGNKLKVYFMTEHGHVISWIKVDKIIEPIKELPKEIKK